MTLKREQINQEKQKEMEKRLQCIFCDDGLYAEMSLDLKDYNEKTQPLREVSFGFYQGDIEVLKETVASVDEEWVQYFDKDTLVFCGYIKKKPVSFCIVERDEDCIISKSGIKVGGIGCVGTVPQYRNLGIGLRMVDLATLYLKNEGCDKSYIHYTHIDQWYGKLGYQTFARFSIIR